MPDDFPQHFTPRILVIDDNPSLHEAFTEILRADGANAALDESEVFLFGPPNETRVKKPAYQMDHAMSGSEGVEKIRQANDAGRQYQLVFVDIRMPGMDGIETIEQIWRIDDQIQTVICTAYSDYRWEDLAKRFGLTDRLLMLKKPFHDLEVMQLASTLTRKWFLARQAEMKFAQMETLVAQRTGKLLDFQRREHQRIQALDQTKIQLLLNLAQEFRDPLLVMAHALENMPASGTWPAGMRDAILRNHEKLLKLVDESLLMRRFELEDRELVWAELEVVGFLRGLMEMLAVGGRDREIKLKFQAEFKPVFVKTDRYKLEKALFNLFGCLMGMASPHSSVCLRLYAEDAAMKLCLEIKPPLRQNTLPINGGIELLLGRELVRLLGGDMSSLAETPESSKLSVELPIMPCPRPQTGAEFPSVPEFSAEVSDRELPVVLLLGESENLRGLIVQELVGNYSILEIQKTEEAVVIARENIPDLIIIGGQLPPKDARKLCADWKKAELTSHIPIIMLYADRNDEDRVAAWEVGVDDILEKPFRLPILKARVDNLLENRRKLHEHFQQLQTIQPREMATNSMDAEFLRRVVEIVEKNLADYEFDVETLARQLALSRRQLFRKFKAIAGCTPNVFIRDIRLKHAAQLLRNSGMTVSEIIYAVGFSDPKYFRNIFRERFGVLPGDYNKQAKLQRNNAAGLS